MLLVYLQRFKEAEGAQPSAAGHQTESGIVEHLLVVVPAGTHTHTQTCCEFTDVKMTLKERA